ncbi:hypothetical protein ACIQ6K_38865 [Streptomyces sp. NPDC096354]|uniref:hypothetical protein n=1 Tax=Streptomyces sp. NPDC096354 TaxID=3366088 RepID=UPI00382984BA
MAGELAQVDTPPAQVVRTVEQRWAAHADPGTAERWRGGQTLLHTDFAAHNILLGETRDWLIDWAWPTVGPSWVERSSAASTASAPETRGKRAPPPGRG